MKKITISIIILDQLIKILLINILSLNQSIQIITNLFNITLAHNPGAAFSILSNSRIFLILISLIILFLIYKYLIKNKKLTKLEKITYSLLIGGIIGNLIDRILYGYVIDYLDFKIFNYNFPIFNLADITICLSVFLILISLIKGENNE